MRTLLTSPEPQPRGTVYTSAAALPLNTTLVDVRPADLFPVNRTLPAASMATTWGWISFDLNR